MSLISQMFLSSRCTAYIKLWQISYSVPKMVRQNLTQLLRQLQRHNSRWLFTKIRNKQFKPRTILSISKACTIIYQGHELVSKHLCKLKHRETDSVLWQAYRRSWMRHRLRRWCWWIHCGYPSARETIELLSWLQGGNIRSRIYHLLSRLKMNIIRIILS